MGGWLGRWLGGWPWGWCMAWCVLAVVGQAQAAAGAVIESARVIRVVDGDSLWVRPPTGAPLRLRLSGVDAPELCQRHGPQSRDALAARVLHQPLRVTLLHKDSYDRWLARLEGPDGNEDVGAWLVGQGLAWAMRWQNKPGAYAEQEAQARRARRGLFAESRPENPRDFRRRHGPCVPAGNGPG